MVIYHCHDHDHTVAQKSAALSSALPPPSRAHRIASNPSLPKADDALSSEGFAKKATHFFTDREPVAPPPATAYGTFEGSSNGIAKATSKRHQARRSPSQSSQLSIHQPLAPAQRPDDQTVMEQVSHELIPFAGMFASVRNWFRGKRGYSLIEDGKNPFGQDASQRKWQGPVHQRIGSSKHRRIADAKGENLPLEILRCISEWFSVLEDRNTVPGTSLGSLIGCVAAMEETLSGLERILTTPLPFGYSVHIRHTVWIYLFFLPFQLVEQFAWYTIPGVAVAAFIYLGFLAAGEEIEQPFGYDENDLDLDMFCQEIIHVDIVNLKKSPCLNAYLEPQQQELTRHRSMTLIEASLHSDSETDY